MKAICLISIKTLSYIQCTVIYIFFPEIQNLAVSLILLLSRPLPPRLIEIENSGLKNFPMTPTWDRYYFKPRGSARASSTCIRLLSFSADDFWYLYQLLSETTLGLQETAVFPKLFFRYPDHPTLVSIVTHSLLMCTHIFISC